jgi:hypothetical protein
MVHGRYTALRGLFWFVVFERGAIESRKDGPTHDVAGRHTSGLEPENPTISKVLKREGLKPMRASPSVRFATLEPGYPSRIEKTRRREPAGCLLFRLS